MTDVLRIRRDTPQTLDTAEGIRMILYKEDREVYLDDTDEFVLCIVGGNDKDIRELIRLGFFVEKVD